MRERGAERQRGPGRPGQLRIVMQLRFERNGTRQDMFCKHSFLSFPLRPNDNASRFTAVLSTLSGDSGDRHVWDVNWNLSSLSPLSFSFYSKTQPPEQNNCRTGRSLALGEYLHLCPCFLFDLSIRKRGHKCIDLASLCTYALDAVHA